MPASSVRRVVSLVPSLTETVAVSAPGLLVGATDWCTHPADLEVRRVRGTKNPDIAAVVALAPDLVLANAEENRPADVEALRRNGLQLLVSDVRTVRGEPGTAALGPGGQLETVLRACGVDRPAWLDQADAAWGGATRPAGAAQRRAVVPVWRRPWMGLGRDTFAGDVLRLLGVDNVLADDPERYPRFDVTRLPAYDLVVLPDEPYAFAADDGPEAFPHKACALVSGRHLTWYGPSLVEARAVLERQLSVLTTVTT